MKKSNKQTQQPDDKAKKRSHAKGKPSPSLYQRVKLLLNPFRRNNSEKHNKLLPAATVLEETASSDLIRLATGTLCLTITALLLWAGLTTIEESAKTLGEVIPSGRIQTVQHLEGGIIQDVLVRDGDHVNAGDILVQLNPTSATAELERAQAHEMALLLDSARLHTFISNDHFDPTSWGNKVIASDYNSVKSVAEIRDMVREEGMLLDLQYKSREDQQAVLDAQIEQLKEEITDSTQRTKTLERNLELLNQEKGMYDSIQHTNAFSKKNYLEVLRAINQAEGELASLRSTSRKNQQALKETQSRRLELDSNLRETAQQELDDINSELISTRHTIARLKDRVQRLNLTAPVSGIVKGLEVTPGTVIQPGGKVLEVVPTDSKLIVETQILPRDVGHISVGDSVKVKVIAFDYSRYGAIEGKLEKISASTFLDENGNPYYRGYVNLDKQYVGKNAERNHLIPGMTVEADINTGRRSLLTYLLKPIRRGISESFTER